MTEAVFYRDKYKRRVRITGHATGSPEVCAMVSAVAQTLETALLYLEPKEYEATISRGDVEIAAAGLGVIAAFDVAALTMGRIAKTYPGLVRVRWEEDNDEL